MTKQPAPLLFYAAKRHKRLGLVWAAVSQRGVWSAAYGIDEPRFCDHILERGPAQLVKQPAAAADVLEQIHEFLAGTRRRFELNVDLSGMTPFQVAVRKAVMAVRYGQTASYGDIAAAVGKPRAARAVGGVQAGNPISFIIPCHRIIGADGSLAGYGGFGGLETKRWLLKLEGTELRKP
ncbi:MAG: methylated-DNA--[protein]-cysteine S-methyltransferase [Anaerolineales bacterium]|nr:MAG: methylated-DNA--[protein]-cysteine S-methyltransferase [Anaerolineales bacterium]